MPSKFGVPPSRVILAVNMFLNTFEFNSFSPYLIPVIIQRWLIFSLKMFYVNNLNITFFRTKKLTTFLLVFVIKDAKPFKKRDDF